MRQPDRRRLRAKSLHHRRGNLFGGSLALQMIRVREEKPFQAGRGRIHVLDQVHIRHRSRQKVRVIHQLGLFQPLGNVVDVRALRNRYRYGIDVAPLQPVIHLGNGGGAVEPVLSCLQRAFLDKTHQFKGIPASNDAAVLQLRAHLANRGSRGEIDKRLRRRANRRKDDVSSAARQCRQKDKNQKNSHSKKPLKLRFRADGY